MISFIFYTNLVSFRYLVTVYLLKNINHGKEEESHAKG